MRGNQRGFIELRFLIALGIVLSLLPITVSGMSLCANLNFDYSIINDEISLFQLRRILLISYDIKNHYDSLTFLYKGKECELSCVNERLILTPGYQMFLDEVEDLYFMNEEDCLYVCYTKKNKFYKTPINKTKGIYLDNFSDCIDESSSDTFSNE